MTTNPYEYTETSTPAVPSADGEFPPTPFTIALTYRDKPCLLTVEKDHLVIEGESLREPIRVDRHERYRLNSCIYYYGDNKLIIWHRPTRKEFTFQITESGMSDLKISWLITWKEGVQGERTPESHVKKMSGKWLYGKPMSWLVINAVVFFGSVLRRLDWKITPIHDKLWYIAAFVLMLTITAFVLMLCRKKAGILLTLVTLASMFIAVSTSHGTLSMLMYDDEVWSAMLPFVLFFTWLMCVMPFLRVMRLDRQIRERLTEY